MIVTLMVAAAVLACHPLTGERILGRDLADASEAFRALPADLVVGYAPRPGVRRLLDVAELARIAAANKVAVSGLAPLCFERAALPPDADAATAAMRKSLDGPDARIEIVALSKYPAPPGELVFPRSALLEPSTGDASVWNGYVSYEGGRFPVWAKVRVTVPQKRVVAAVDLMPGVPVRAEDVRIEESFAFPRRTRPLASLEDAIGLSPRRMIRSGEPLVATALLEPYEVNAGQTVAVEVRSGSALLRLEAKAESGGRRGDMISLRNSASGKVFRAKVEEKGRVLVECRTAPEKQP